MEKRKNNRKRVFFYDLFADFTPVIYICKLKDVMIPKFLPIL